MNQYEISKLTMILGYLPLNDLRDMCETDNIYYSTKDSKREIITKIVDYAYEEEINRKLLSMNRHCKCAQ